MSINKISMQLPLQQTLGEMWSRTGDLKINLCIYSQKKNIFLVNVLRTYIDWINNYDDNKMIGDFSINGTRKLAPNLFSPVKRYFLRKDIQVMKSI